MRILLIFELYVHFVFITRTHPLTLFQEIIVLRMILLQQMVHAV